VVISPSTSTTPPTSGQHGHCVAQSFFDLESTLAYLSADLDGQISGAAEFPSAEQVAGRVRETLDRPLSEDLSGWVEAYARHGRRDPYLWRWCRQAVEVTTLPCVLPSLRDELLDTKTLGVMFDVLLDDVADRHGSAKFLEELVHLPVGHTAPDFSQFGAESRAYGEFTRKLWEAILARARKYPCYVEYADLLRFDYLQLCNVMRYSHLLNSRLELLNTAEHDLYTPHNMHIMICSTFDLMCSPQFDRGELGILRDCIWHVQWMGRIGNLVTTWQRELAEGDFTSGVYARAVTNGDVTVEQLRRVSRDQLEVAIAAGGHELFFLRRWREHRQYVLSKKPLIRSFDLGDLLDGFNFLICLHLASRGRK